MTPSRAAQEKPTSPRTEAGKALVEWASRAYPEHIDVWREHAVLIEREAAATTPSLDPRQVAQALRDVFENEFGGVLSIHWEGRVGLKPMDAAERLAEPLIVQIEHHAARLDEGSATPAEADND